jgi:hypothetical protein
VSGGRRERRNRRGVRQGRERCGRYRGRGRVPQWTEPRSFAWIGRGFASLAGLQLSNRRPGSLVVGWDGRDARCPSGSAPPDPRRSRRRTDPRAGRFTQSSNHSLCRRTAPRPRSALRVMMLLVLPRRRNTYRVRPRRWRRTESRPSGETRPRGLEHARTRAQAVAPVTPTSSVRPREHTYPYPNEVKERDA